MIKEFSTVSRLYIDGDEFMPVARVTEYFHSNELCREQVFEYKNDFLQGDDLPGGWLDPRSIGYGVAKAAKSLDRIENEVPVYWLGEELQSEGLGEVVLQASTFADQ